MKEYLVKNLRNVGIVGHSGSGKTTLSEAILFKTGVIDRIGKTEDGTTISDFEAEEKKRGISIYSSILPCDWHETKINLIDIPGYFDFEGELIEGMRAADIAIITVSAGSGIKVGTEKAWDYVNRISLPRSIFINKLDKENANFEKTLLSLKEKFGISVVPVQYPIYENDEFIGVVNVISHKARIHDKKTGKMIEEEVPERLLDRVLECKTMIMEAVAENDEKLLDKYFSQGSLSMEEIYEGLISGCVKGEIAPVMCGSASKGVGITTLLEDIVECFPSPLESLPQKARIVKDDGTEEEVYKKYNEKEPFSAFVFKTIADPFVGKMSLFKVITGKIKGDTNIYNSNKGKTEKIGNVFLLRGKNQIQTKEIIAGDIGATAKLQFTETGDTICDPSLKMSYSSMKFPKPSIYLTLIPKSKGDEDKIANGLSKILEEDKTLYINRDNHIIIHGIGEVHLEVVCSKLKSKFGVDTYLEVPRVKYKETISQKVEVQGKHKKQSGGHGQYGDVWIRFEPRLDGIDELHFEEKIVGGVVPKQYIPAVEKGLRESIEKGVLAGYPLIRLKATLYDGSYHPVDSSEMAFKVASSVAYKQGIERAKPILLEPIMKVEILVRENDMGDVIGDINKKRGRVLGMESVNGYQSLVAEVPESEMFKYATDLRSITQGRGEFSMEFLRYDPVDPVTANKIIEKEKSHA